MSEKQKLLIIALFTGIITCLIIGSTFAYWSWQTNSSQLTEVTFTIASGFTCGADGGGNITSNNAISNSKLHNFNLYRQNSQGSLYHLKKDFDQKYID